MPIVLLCPGCKTRLTVGDDRAGTTFGCPRCATPISVPVVESATPPVPMIRFPCPDCGKKLKAPDGAAGRSGRCSCGASFVVPVPEVETCPTPTPARRPASPPYEIVDEPEPDEEPDPNYRPRRKRKARYTGRWLVLGFVFLAPVTVLVWFSLREPRDETPRSQPTSDPFPRGAHGAAGVVLPPPPDVSGDGPDWTYRELLDYFRSRGLVVMMAPCSGGQFYMLSDDDRDAVVYASSVQDGSIDSRAVVCNKLSSVRSAKELADRRESGTFSWGRYCFSGDPKTLDLFRQTLVGRGPVTDGFADWTYEQLVAHLKVRGFSVKVRAYPEHELTAAGPKLPDGARLFVLTDRDDEADERAALYATTRISGGASILGSDANPLDPRAAVWYSRAIICVKAPTSIHARFVAGKGYGLDGDKRCFDWRRFAFLIPAVGSGTDGTANALGAKLRKALGPP